MSRRHAAVLAAAHALALVGALAAGEATPKAKSTAERQPIHVWADRIRYLHAENRALVTGNATVIKHDLRIDCDRLEATLDPKTSRFTKMVGMGNVRICTVKPVVERTNPRPKLELLPNARRAMCARGEYDPVNEIVILKGSVHKQPVVHVGKDTVQADLITYDRKRDIMLFEGHVKLSAMTPKRGDTLGPLAAPGTKP